MELCNNRSSDGKAIRQKIAKENYDIIRTRGLPKLNIRKPIHIDAERGIRDIERNFGKRTRILFLGGTTNQAIHYFHQMRMKCAVMNFANSHHVGGGYTHGSFAQEEELCRTIPDLFPSLAHDANRNKDYIDERGNSTFHWMKDIKYSPDLNLYRYDCAQSNGKYDFFTLTDPIPVSVITVAAPNLGFKSDTHEPKHPDIVDDFLRNPGMYFGFIKNIIRNSCLAPIFANRQKEEGVVNVLVLGAFGCGAFRPSPKVESQLGGKYNQIIANLFVDVLRETPNLLTTYDYICFAIPPGENYDEFKNVFLQFRLPFNEDVPRDGPQVNSTRQQQGGKYLYKIHKYEDKINRL
jgi:uncharacterized protein (TIGR02452 family)